MAATRSHRRPLLAFAALLAALPVVLPNQYFYDVAILVGLNAIVCIGLNLLIGYAGQISLGHAAFFGLGAYGSGILATAHGWPPVASIAAVAFAVGVLAFVVGRPVLRLRGHYLAMATLGLGVIASIVIATEDRITGGPDGMSVAPLSVFGASLSDQRGWYALVACLLVVSVVIAQRLIDSPIGRALRALHGGEAAAQLAGIDAARYKVMAFVLSAVFAAVAGALGAHYSGFITPAKVGFLHSVELVTMVVFGGLASTWGAVVGAAVLTLLPHLLTVFKDYEMVVLGGVMMATMILMPRGLVPTLADFVRRRGA
jgi:branched-chain amino acid transport system permease protein